MTKECQTISNMKFFLLVLSAVMSIKAVQGCGYKDFGRRIQGNYYIRFPPYLLSSNQISYFLKINVMAKKPILDLKFGNLTNYLKLAYTPCSTQVF